MIFTFFYLIASCCVCNTDESSERNTASWDWLRSWTIVVFVLGLWPRATLSPRTNTSNMAARSKGPNFKLWRCRNGSRGPPCSLVLERGRNVNIEGVDGVVRWIKHRNSIQETSYTFRKQNRNLFLNLTKCIWCLDVTKLLPFHNVNSPKCD